MPRPNWTEQDLENAKNRMGKGVVATTGKARIDRDAAASDLEHGRGRGGGLASRSRVGNPAPSLYRSKLEAAWANYLDVLKAAQDIDGWRYEPVNFRLPGQKNFYKVDFCSWVGREVTFYEIKGRNKSDDRSLVKLKTAAWINAWARFVLVKRIEGNWEERVIA